MQKSSIENLIISIEAGIFIFYLNLLTLNCRKANEVDRGRRPNFPRSQNGEQTRALFLFFTQSVIVLLGWLIDWLIDTKNIRYFYPNWMKVIY